MSASEEEKMSPELQQFLMAEQAKAQMQQTVARLTDTCWDKCIGTPGRSLSSREESCLSECAKRFIETTQFVVQRFRSKNSTWEPPESLRQAVALSMQCI